MTYNSPAQTIAAGEIEYFDLEQAAAICCVSCERFAKWIQRGAIPVVEYANNTLIHSHDLIRHLIRHNIPIPERLLSGRSKKKALFVLTNDQPSQAIIKAVLRMVYRMREQDVAVVDLVRQDADMELKVITLNPDLIFVLQKEGTDQQLENSLRRMLIRDVPVFRIPTDRMVDLDLFYKAEMCWEKMEQA